MTFVSQETRRAAGKRQLSDFASEEDVWSSITAQAQLRRSSGVEAAGWMAKRRDGRAASMTLRRCQLQRMVMLLWLLGGKSVCND